jgi:protein-S-isoprenylcysteine O-methyltransferase Ste14
MRSAWGEHSRRRNIFIRAIINVVGIVVFASLVPYLMSHQLAQPVEAAIIISGALWIYPVSVVGRWMLDRSEGVECAKLMTTMVHYLIFWPLGAAILLAGRWAAEGRGPRLPALGGLTEGVGWPLAAGGATLVTASMANLLIAGLGAPWAVALSRRVASRWLYRYVRNPMVLGASVFLLGLALGLRSAFLLAWTALDFFPAIVFFLKVYEERELEHRFGASYLEYKAKTPFLVPRIGTREPDD